MGTYSRFDFKLIHNCFSTPPLVGCTSVRGYGYRKEPQMAAEVTQAQAQALFEEALEEADGRGSVSCFLEGTEFGPDRDYRSASHRFAMTGRVLGRRGRPQAARTTGSSQSSTR